MVALDALGLVLGLRLLVVDVKSRGNNACSVGGNNIPDGVHLTWLGLLGGDDHVIFYSRCIHSLHLPGLDGHWWCRWLLCCLDNLLSLLRHAEGVALGRSLLICFSVGLGEWIVPLALK
jgi:hypothetical protein